MIEQELSVVDLQLHGAFIIKPKKFTDDRGSFFKLYTREILSMKNVKPMFNEEYLSISKKGVIRGLHYQSGNFAQAKLIRCVKGEIFDVIVDLRKSSPTFGNWENISLSSSNQHCLYVPRGFAHGFLALTDGTEVLYKADNDYSPEHECGICWDDQELSINWPKLPNYIISKKDGSYPPYNKVEKFL